MVIRFKKKLSRKHYMQCGLAILLTCIFLILTSSLWSNKNIIVSFDSESVKDFNYQVFYTEHKEQKFNQNQLITKPVQTGSHHIEIILPINNIVKFRLDIGWQPGRVVIRNLKLVGEKTINLDYNQFNKNDIDSYTTDNNLLSLSSNKNDPYITYKPELDLSAKVSIDWYVLVIYAILFFLVFYKLVKYLAKFKIEKNYSRIDIVMLAVFFGLLFLPMTHISDAEKSEQENRMLAKYQPLWKNNTFNYQFGTDFEAWYNDHFFGRNVLIYLYNSSKYLIVPIAGNEKVLVGKNNWLFSKSFSSTKVYQNLNRFTEEELIKIGHNLEHFVTRAKQHGIKEIYFVLDNDKESLYGEYYPSYITKMYNESRLDQLLNYVHEQYPTINFLNFKDRLQRIKDTDVLFYKTGTHMTLMGGFYTYQFLMERIKKDFPDMDILTLNDFEIYESKDFDQPELDLDIYNMLKPLFYPQSNIKNKILKLLHPKIKLEYHSANKYIQTNLFTNDKVKNNLKIFAIGDSFLLRNIRYIATGVNRTWHVFVGFGKDLSFTEDSITELYKNIPDIMIIQTTERFLQRFLSLEFPTNPNIKED